MTNVYAVSEDDVIWFGSIRECREWIREKAFFDSPSYEWSIYKVSDYDDPDPDADAYPLETYSREDFISYIITPGRDGYISSGAVDLDEARRIAAKVLSQGRRHVEIRYLEGRRNTRFVESYDYPNMPKLSKPRSAKPKGKPAKGKTSKNVRGRGRR